MQKDIQAQFLLISNAAHDDGDNSSQHQHGTELVIERSAAKPKKPPFYKVLLLNDDYTPMEFVIMVLMSFFNMPQPQAEKITMHVHTTGIGICGVFPREIAETKVRMVMDCAINNDHPLQCTLEKE